MYVAKLKQQKLKKIQTWEENSTDSKNTKKKRNKENAETEIWPATELQKYGSLENTNNTVCQVTYTVVN